MPKRRRIAVPTLEPRPRSFAGRHARVGIARRVLGAPSRTLAHRDGTPNEETGNARAVLRPLLAVWIPARSLRTRAQHAAR